MKTRKEFEDLLTKYNNAYRKGEPLISDVEYNSLEEEFKKRFLDFEGALFLSTLRDSPIDKKRKEKLPVKMTSLDKCKSVEEVKKWIHDKTGYAGVDVVITAKYDGISLLVDEESGRCWTKGVVAEQEGQRSDEHFSRMHLSIISRLKMTIGEAIMKRSIFNTRYSKKEGGKYSHPRNMVAGLFNANEPNPALVDVDYISYGHPRRMRMNIDKRDQVIEFDIPYIMIDSFGLYEEFLDNIFYNWKQKLGYDIDGLVIDINDADLRQDCTDMASGNVGYAVAYKHPSWSQKVSTVVKSIEMNVSKQGKLKPVAILESVDIDGVEISRVTVSNMKTVTELCLCPGCEIEIKRSGDVIPKITKVHGVDVPQRDEIPNDKEFKEAWKNMITIFLKTGMCNQPVVPDKCPSCGSPLFWDETKTELICSTTICTDRLIAKAVYFFETMGVENFGEPSIRQIQREIGSTHPLDIMNLSAGDFLGMSGWGSISVNNLLNQFNKIRIEGVPLAKFLTALDLFEGKIGEKTCQLIFDNIDLGELEEIMRKRLPMTDMWKKLTSIKGVSDITAQAFYNGYSDYIHHSSAEGELKVSYIQTPKTELKSESFLLQQICFTGFRNKEWERVVIENGGKIVDSVSKNTTILVVKNLGSNSSKMKRANELGVKIMSESEFEGFLKT